MTRIGLSSSGSFGPNRHILNGLEKQGMPMSWFLQTWRTYEAICARNEVQNRHRMEARLRKQARERGLQLVAI
jgi:hypothetical protein